MNVKLDGRNVLADGTAYDQTPFRQEVTRNPRPTHIISGRLLFPLPLRVAFVRQENKRALFVIDAEVRDEDVARLQDFILDLQANGLADVYGLLNLAVTRPDTDGAQACDFVAGSSRLVRPLARGRRAQTGIKVRADDFI